MKIFAARDEFLSGENAKFNQIHELRFQLTVGGMDRGFHGYLQFGYLFLIRDIREIRGLFLRL